jgi:SpoVK/Ycf46/Vps4 family AAA+-type ATPase
MDGLAQHKGPPVVVIAATNRLEDIEPALCRPGRFSHAIEVSPPETLQEMAEVLAVHLRLTEDGTELGEDGEPVELLAPALHEAVIDREAWLLRILDPKGADWFGVHEVIRYALLRSLTGDDIREVMSRITRDWAASEILWGSRLGQVTVADLMTWLIDYVQEKERLAKARKAEDPEE